MELVKEIASKGPESQGNIAIRVDEKSYTYLQMISSATSISSLLSNLDPKIGNGVKRNVDLGGARVGIDISVMLSTDDPQELIKKKVHQELMNTLAVKTGAYLSLIPPIPSAHLSAKHDHAKAMVPTMYTRLIQYYEEMDPKQKAASASAARHLRLMMCGSSALPFPIMQRWETITGHRLLEYYGMTEFVMAISNPIRGKPKGGTVGKPFSVVQAKILLDDESGSDKSELGELCIKSPSLFKEYWKVPEVINHYTIGSTISNHFLF
ncbi:malonate--coa ligase [Nicotiana attenuata]|uniref:Malonate--coa ligase n=1 Tax=Nicotiana attenuata TaxID=49451 RepID=A0A1J6ILT5_NICAT|nr:malonate--coa ligase [Nicotiana attenuata]